MIGTRGPLSDKRTQRLSKQQLESREEQDSADLRVVLSTPAGRRWYAKVTFDLCHILSLSFDLTVKDGLCAEKHGAFMDGQRSIGQTLYFAAQEEYPELWNKLMTERLAQGIADRAEQEAINSPQEKTDDRREY
jgi:hypothetical protein